MKTISKRYLNIQTFREKDINKATTVRVKVELLKLLRFDKTIDGVSVFNKALGESGIIANT